MKIVKKRILKGMDFVKILKGYDIGEFRRVKFLESDRENMVYVLWTTKGKFVLKDLIDVNYEEYLLQMKFIDCLCSSGVRVVLNIKDRNDKDVIDYAGRKIIVQKFLEGIHPKRFSVGLIRDVARNVGFMHKVSLGLKYKEAVKRGYELKDFSRIGVSEKVFDIQRGNIERLNRVDFRKIRECRIHGDMSEGNMLVKNNKLVAFIDFDDSDVNYLVYEIAIFIAHVFIKRRAGVQLEKIKVFLHEYEKVIGLSREEKAVLYDFILYRLFGILYWYKRYEMRVGDVSKFGHHIERMCNIIEMFGRYDSKSLM